ncbi:MAG: outer membrane protein assembly factor BamA [Neomegalonema sp.]|nr:outer membrane protein assembly factor BamA [Neomegalonema sp.]
MTLRRATIAKAILICMAAIVASVGPAMTSGGAAWAQETVERLSKIEVRGAQRVERETIVSYLRLAPGDALTKTAVNDALKRLFATGLFKDVSITPRPGGLLLVDVAENPVISEISFEGNSAIKDKVLQAQIRSRPRGAFTRARAEADALTILDAYRAAGRYSATVEPKIIERKGNRVDLVFEIKEGKTVGILSINFVGNDEYSDRRLRSIVQTSESAWWKVLATSDNYNPDRIEVDKQLLRRFYFARGYADFEVVSAVAELSPDRDGFIITFTVSEGERYDVGDVGVFSRIPKFDPKKYAGLIATVPGDTYDADLVQRTVKKMQQRLAEDGVRFVDVKPQARKRRADGKPVVDIRYVFVDAPRLYVERIEIEGNSRTLDHVIRREFDFVEGDAFSTYGLTRSRSRIRALGFFGKTEVKTAKGSAPDRVVVRAKVKEKATGDLSFGIGFSSVDSLGGTISLTERNFLGRGQLVRISIAASSSRQTYDFAFIEPYFLGRNLEAGIQVFHIESDQSDESDFETKRSGFSPSIGFPIDEYSKIRLRYKLVYDNIVEVPSSASPLVKADKGGRLVSSVGYDYTLDFRNSKNQPTEGFILTLNQTFAGVGGDTFYLRSKGKIKGYTSFFREDVIVSLSLEGGAIVGLGGDDDVKISDRFSLGGDEFRGFRKSGVGPRDTHTATISGTTYNYDAALGGNYYALLRADISFPLGLPEEYGIFGGVFADVGSVWGLDDTRYATDTGTLSVDDSFKLRATAGVSLFWTSPFGPLRFNLAVPIQKEEEDKDEFFSFGVATRF